MSLIFEKTILICGGAGFIGSNFIQYFYNKYPEYRLVNLDALTYSGNRQNLVSIESKEMIRPLVERRYHFVQGDICDSQILNRLFKEYNFSSVINFAAESHVDRSLCSSYDFIRTNINGVHNLIETSRRHSLPRFIQISTDEVYGDVPVGFSFEDSPLNPSSPYSASKASADLLIKSYTRSHKLPAIIVRGSNNFGPLQYPEKLVPLAISNFLENKKMPVHGTGQHIRSWLYVIDFCRAIDLVLHKGRENETYNVSGTAKTNLEVLQAIHKALRLSGHLDNHKIHTRDRPGADLRYAPGDSKIQHELGWTPKYIFDVVLNDTVEWYLNNQAWWKEIKQKSVFIEHYKRQEQANYY
ncbi:MAG: dTDP-glucose 4,6-dehydratase [Candidatus Peregrinibacteria bacterium GW2011_GWC2_39_14]|nr:MAG: dTDP-glucose 4,6-dehydratase [Candidatus Peregrinibacteria bacterium GW2011_GWC2_39_14]